MSNEYKLVPVVPTEAMMKAATAASAEGDQVYLSTCPEGVWDKFGKRANRILHIYDAMLIASPVHDGEAVKPYFSIEFKDYVATIIPGETDGMKNGKVDCYLQGRTLYTEPPRVVDVELLKMLVRIRDDKTWRTNDNALWPDLLAMIRKHESALENQ